MRRVGLLLMALGLVCLAASGGLTAKNRVEDSRAGAASAQILANLEAAPPETIPAEDSSQTFFGRLTIPRLELELPVLPEWSYENLKIAPCRYSGSVGEENLVLIAHNYRTHFGPIRRLKPGDQVVFEDLDGTVFEYRVAAVEAVSPAALEEVTAGIHDLTLITCTYGGKTRVAVWCDTAEP